VIAEAEPIEAWLFDLDGTLIDSMPLHHDAWRRWHADMGLAFDDQGFFAATAGRTNAEILGELFPGRSEAERGAMAEAKESIYRDEARQRLTLIPGADDVLKVGLTRGLPMAVCTAAPDGNIAVAYERFGIGAQVATTVSPEQGFRGKPHPDLFLEAARRLGIAPERCLVFEDAPLGVEAARRAGMRAVALTTTAPAAAFAEFDNLVETRADLRGFDLR
jgi:HAD superfamily hydrolase (TIGR01509 family)